MRQSNNETRNGKIIKIALACIITLTMVVPLDMAEAKRDGDNDNRSEYYGIVQSRPKKVREGEWVIGGRTFTADAGTEFDQTEGTLTVGRCAKVHIRNGRVHEIDSEPMRNCQ